MEFIKISGWDLSAAIVGKQFPFDALTLNKKGLGIKIAAYSNSKDYIKVNKLEKYTREYDGFAVKEKEVALVFYADTLSYAQRNKVIMHEVAHVVLGHTTYNHILGHSPDKEVQNRQETEATLFALSFLAPAPTLWRMGIKDPVEIARRTGLSLEDSRFIADEVFREGKRMQEKKSKKLKLAALVVLLVAVLSLGAWAICISTSPTALPPDTVAPVAPQTEDVSATVYVTKSGERYHLEDCQHVKNKGISLSLENAKKEGYTPCKVCKPSA